MFSSGGGGGRRGVDGGDECGGMRTLVLVVMFGDGSEGEW